MWLWSPEHLTNGPLFFYSEPFLILFVPVGQSARLVPLVLKVYSARVQLRSILWVKDLRSDRADLSSALFAHFHPSKSVYSHQVCIYHHY